MQPLDFRVPPTEPDLSSADLVREAVDDAKQLIRLELELAKDEVKHEIGALRNAAIAIGIGAAVLLVGVSVLVVALALAIFPGPIPALILGGALVVVASLVALLGIKLLPKRPLAETRRRIETDFETMKERIQ